ncbi:MAG: LuxR C-terminal-related transcriptional regulator, partial [Gemmatimonadaceae bacterium]
QGLSEKNIATAVGLAPTTVHQYVQKLYRHFDVNTRAEILSYFIKRQPKLRGRSSAQSVHRWS